MNNAVVPNSENWMRSQTLVDSILVEPEVYRNLIKTYGEQNFSIQGMSKILGGERFVSNMAQRHAEDVFLHQSFTVNAHAAWGANAQADFTIGAAFEYDYPENPSVPYESTVQTQVIPLYDTMIIEFPNGVTAWVFDVDAAAGTFSCFPQVLGTEIPITLTTDVIIITGNVKGERTAANPSRDSQVTWYFTNMQNSDWSYSMSGNARQEKAWITTDAGEMWYMVGQLKEMQRAKNEIEFQLLTSQPTTNTNIINTIANDTAVIKAPTTISTLGMIPFIQNYGQNLPYNTISYITLQDWENFVTGTLVPNVAAEEYALFCSSAVNNYFDRFIRSEMKMGGVQYAAFNGSEEQSVNFGFRWFASSEHIFYKKHAEAFDYKPVMGAVGHKYSGMAVGAPLDKTDKTLGWDDMSTTKNLPQFLVNYQTNRKFHERMLGAMDGVSTTRVDELEIIANSTYGIELFAGQRWFTVKKQGT